MSVKLRLLNKWGGYKPGDIVQFDDSKAAGLLTHGLAEKVSAKEKALNVPESVPPARPKGKPRAETATAVPRGETMDITPTAGGDLPSVDAPAHSGGRKAGE